MSLQLRSARTALMLTSALVLSACGAKAPKDLPPPPADVPARTTAVQPSQRAPVIPGSQQDFVERMMGQDTILFDTDRFQIDATDAAALQAQATWLQSYPAKSATIEGHADERGTRDYNLALGERRANAAKNYLVGLGISAGRLTTVSYGKERPLASGSDEASWAKNRRAVTVTID